MKVVYISLFQCLVFRHGSHLKVKYVAFPATRCQTGAPAFQSQTNIHCLQYNKWGRGWSSNSFCTVHFIPDIFSEEGMFHCSTPSGHWEKWKAIQQHQIILVMCATNTGSPFVLHITALFKQHTEAVWLHALFINILKSKELFVVAATLS